MESFFLLKILFVHLYTNPVIHNSVESCYTHSLFMEAVHEIDYEIFGTEMQFVEIELDPMETVIAEAGAFMMMEAGIEMKTILGDGTKRRSGLFGKLSSIGQRYFSGESLFMTAFTHTGDNDDKQKVAFAAPYPGKIIPVDLRELGGKIVCQKDAFLCAARGVTVGIEFSKKLGRGLFGGEGFIMQNIVGDGFAFLHAGGTVVERELVIGEQLIIDTGCLVGFTNGVSYDIKLVKGIKNMMLGGEGLFLTTLEGPGTVWVQSLPFSRLADRVITNVNWGKGEGSILGKLGDMLDGKEE